jgi:hypothetical protein
MGEKLIKDKERAKKDCGVDEQRDDDKRAFFPSLFEKKRLI